MNKTRTKRQKERKRGGEGEEGKKKSRVDVCSYKRAGAYLFSYATNVCI